MDDKSGESTVGEAGLRMVSVSDITPSCQCRHRSFGRC